MRNLTPEALAFFQALPPETRLSIQQSNLCFHTVEDLKNYESSMLAHVNEVLYRELPDPGIPSNAALDPLDSQDP